MNQRAQSYVTGSFIFHGKQNFYQIALAGKDSIIRMYDNTARLCISRKQQIPSSVSRIIPCDRYLIYFSPTKISIHELTNSVAKIVSCQNPGIQEIRHCIYNKQANLFYVVDNRNRLFYLMHTTIDIRPYMLCDCKIHNIHSEILKIGADSKGNVYLLYENKILKLCLNLETDSIKSKKQYKNVVDMYFNSTWQVIIQKKQKRPGSQLSESQQYYEIIVNQGKYDVNVPKNQYIIKQNHNQLIIFDRNFTSFRLWHDGILQPFQVKQAPLLQIPQNLDIKNVPLLFQIYRYSHNTSKIIINLYNGIQTSFDRYQRILKVSEDNDSSKNSLNDILYIHNNIQLIFNMNVKKEGGKGIINPYYAQKIHKYIKYCEKNQGVNCMSESQMSIGSISQKNIFFDDQQLAVKFLSNLFQNNPKTTIKLVNHLCQNKKLHFSEVNYLSEFVNSLFKIIDQILKNKGDQLLEAYANFQKSALLNHKNYENIRSMLKNTIKFISIVVYTIKNQHFFIYQKNIKNYTMRSDQYRPQTYESTLNNAKSLYLLNQLVKRSQKIEKKLKGWQFKIINKINSPFFGDLPHKTTFCHNMFQDNSIASFDIKVQRKKQLITYLQFLAKSTNFYQSSYIYYNLIKEQAVPDLKIEMDDKIPSQVFASNISSIPPSKNDIHEHKEQIIYFNYQNQQDQQYEQEIGLLIPYLNDKRILQLIAFLSFCSTGINEYIEEKIQNEEQKSEKDQFYQLKKEVKTKIFQMSSRAILIKQSSFIKFLCTLSVVFGMHACCIGILDSNILQILQNNIHFTQQKFLYENIFIMKLFVCTGKVKQYLKSIKETKRQYYQRKNILKFRSFKTKQDFQLNYYEKILQSFVKCCLLQGKVKQLFYLQENSSPQQQVIMLKLQKEFGQKNIREINDMLLKM